MVGHLGTVLEQLGDKMWPKSAKMSQDSDQERQDETRWRKWGPEGGRGPREYTQRISMPPPKKHPQMKPGAPPGGSTWNLVELRLGLNLETRRTAAVDEALYTRSHARTAYGTVADIYIYIYIYIWGFLDCYGPGGLRGVRNMTKNLQNQFFNRVLASGDLKNEIG
jgi:hypothetical protein